MFQKLLTGLLVILVLIYNIMETTTIPTNCASNRFECSNGKCILIYYQCDGSNDCKDGSDEENCQNFTCSPGFKCKSAHCIPKAGRCNGRMNCRDKSDELNCSECSRGAFACNGGGCILKEWVCDSEPDCLDGSDESNNDCRNRISNASSLPVPLKSQSFAHWNHEYINVSLAYDDHLVAIYFNYLVNKSTTWPFALLGKAWTYAKRTYEPLHINFRPNIILLGDRYWVEETCFTFSTVDTDWGYPNSIACPTKSKFMWAEEEQGNFESLLFGLCEIIQQMRRPSWVQKLNKFQYKMSNLILYDLYIYFKGYDSPQILDWKAKQVLDYLEDKTNNRKVYYFRDWYLPIYESYSGTEVLQNYFRLMFSYLKFKSATYTYGAMFLNSGEFLHIWSEAAGTDLAYLYKNVTAWTLENDQELKQVQGSYNLNYTINNCHLAYIDQHVAVYFFSPGIYKTPVLKLVSNGWKYIKENYSPYTSQSIYTIHLQYKNIKLHDTSCTALNNGVKKRHNFVTIINFIASDLNINESVFLDKALTSIAHLTLDLTQKMGTWPGRSVSNFTLNSIIIYDIYLGLNLSSYAFQWKKVQIAKSDKSGIFWFRDWYLKIYEDSYKLDTLKSFLILLNSIWDKKDGDLTMQLNMGEFVHFWSAAARRSLLTVADVSFGWNLTLQNEFIQARKDFPNLNYSCTNCDDFHWKSYIDQKTKAREELLPIIIGSFLALFGVTLIVVLTKFALYRKRIRKLNRKIRSLTAKELDEFLSGNLGEGANDLNLNAGILSAPYNTDFELPKDRLVVDQHRILGSGEFGFVFHGILLGDQENETLDMEVAVKTVKPNVEISYFKALLSEIKILTHLGLHENIVSLLGTVTGNIVNREVLIALELCPKGNLLHFLQRKSHQFQDLWTQSIFNEFQTIVKNERDLKETEYLPTLSTQDLLEWSCQVANGMSYIHSKNVIHGDLAARNILLTLNHVAKISDFGLSRQLANYSVYQKTSKTPIPWKWLAIESLVNKTFSVHSDAWSFGITLWEIFSLGKVPYPGKCWDKNFVNNLIAGERLESPEHGNTDIYNLMLNCWKKIPNERISFQETLEVLFELAKRMPGGAGICYRRRQSCTYAAL